MPSPLTARPRFDVLDGIRGIAAIVIMIHHYSLFGGFGEMAGARVAVDLFFILSGLVIAFSYEEKIRKGMRFGDFAAARLIRLAPMFYAGLLLGLLAAIWLPMADSGVSLQAALVNTLCLPYLNAIAQHTGVLVSHGPLFLFNNPAWSLSLELFVNTLFFCYLRTGGHPRLPLLALLSLLCFATVAIFLRQIAPGWNTATYWYGIPRIFSGFFLGVLIFHYRHRLPKPPAWLAISVIAGFFAVIYLPGYTVRLVNTLLLAPLVVWMGATLGAGRLQGLCRWLGELSYPLYITHFPLYRLLLGLGALDRLEGLTRLVVVAALALMLATALLPVERRCRACLAQHWQARRLRAATAAS